MYIKFREQVLASNGIDHDYKDLIVVEEDGTEDNLTKRFFQVDTLPKVGEPILFALDSEEELYCEEVVEIKYRFNLTSGFEYYMITLAGLSI